MSITKLLTDEKTSNEEKLAAVAEVVAGARENYGNTEAEIAIPRVNTTNGDMPFNLLEDEAKVALLRSEVANVKAKAVEFNETHPGTNLNKKIEELLSINGMFTNVAPGTKFDYI